MIDYERQVVEYRDRRARFVMRQQANRDAWPVKIRLAHQRGACIRGCWYPDHRLINGSLCR